MSIGSCFSICFPLLIRQTIGWINICLISYATPQKVNTTVKRAADGSLSGEFEVKTDLCSNSNATFVFTPQGDIKCQFKPLSFLFLPGYYSELLFFTIHYSLPPYPAVETEIKGLVKGLKLNVDAALAAKVLGGLAAKVLLVDTGVLYYYCRPRG